MAKKDLTSGEDLDCIGGFTAYGVIDSRARAAGYLPVEFVEFASMTGAVCANSPIPLANVQLD